MAVGLRATGWSSCVGDAELMNPDGLSYIDMAGA